MVFTVRIISTVIVVTKIVDHNARLILVKRRIVTRVLAVVVDALQQRAGLAAVGREHCQVTPAETDHPNARISDVLAFVSCAEVEQRRS